MDIRDAFFDKLYDIAKNDNNVILLTVDLSSLSLEKFKKDLRNQYINVGVAEQNMVGISAGLSLTGKNVFIYGLAAFTTSRCFEQIKICLSYMNLPVKIIGSGPGFVYANDGTTHHITNDIIIMRSLPNMVIYSPADSVTMSNIAKISYRTNSPVYIRVDKGDLPRLYCDNQDFSEGLSLLKIGKDLLIIATGIMTHQAFELADKLKDANIDTGIIDIYRIKPINEKLLLSFVKHFSAVVTIEEHSIVGGIGSMICEILSDHQIFIPIKRFAISDRYCDKHGNREWLNSFHGLNIDNIYHETLKWYNINILRK